MKDILIVGAGGLAREVAWLIKEINSVQTTWNLLGYVESDLSKIGKPVGSHSIVMDDEQLLASEQSVNVVIAIGNPKIILNVRKRLIQNPRLSFPNLIHPSLCWDRERIQMGIGNIFCAGNIFTTDIFLGDFNIFNLSSTYGHDAKIGMCNVINPGVNLSGNVILGDGCLIGTGAKILENLTIENYVIVGAGAVVTKNVTQGMTVVGVPARPLGLSGN